MSLRAIAADADLLVEAVREASEIALYYFKRDSLRVDFKENDSPVSEGDYAVDKFLRETLTAARPEYGWLSEETVDDEPLARMAAPRTFIVDPIDGTRAYVSGQKTWCISAAVVEDGRPIAGILGCPALGEVLLANADQESACMEGAENSTHDAVIGGRRAYVEQLRSALPTLNITESRYVPSLAYRIAMVADGRLAGTFIRKHAHEWDLAAADLIVSKAGMKLVDADGAPISYNRQNPKLGELVCAKPALIEPMLNVVTGRSIR
ncbi:MAG: 3'(2'),5'-bisphosphate nucleotidase CysQ [Pseudomonadota bacterium]